LKKVLLQKHNATSKGEDQPRVPGSRDKKPDLGRWTIVVHPERCTGCGSCEVACSLRRTGQATSVNSAIRVVHSNSGDTHFPLLCCQCEKAACVQVCPADALTRERDFGIPSVDETKCSSCSSCTLSCPFEVLQLGGCNELPQPCDLCAGAPECVASCSAGAIEFVETTEEVLEKKRELSERIARLSGDRNDEP
jgi:anaerobic carbon-monoxide dehydrogenase iron sulfur subunit